MRLRFQNNATLLLAIQETASKPAGPSPGTLIRQVREVTKPRLEGQVAAAPTPILDPDEPGAPDPSTEISDSKLILPCHLEPLFPDS